MTTRHFLSLFDCSSAELGHILERADTLKRMRRNGEDYAPFTRKVLGMIFEKSSTRTRISFEAGMVQLGGNAIFLSTRDTQLGRGEPIEDTARIASRMVDIIMIRTFEHERLTRFAEYSAVPVINALSDFGHPCQLLADMQAFIEHRGPIEGKRVAWIGDGNNMCNSYIEAAIQFDFTLDIACPQGYEPDPSLVERGGNRVRVTHDPREAATDAHLITTDVWTSMGQEAENLRRLADFSGFQVNAELMAVGAEDAVFLHCLPAHREEEVSAAVIDGPQSVVWDQAENRLHAQKALMEFLLNDAAQ